MDEETFTEFFVITTVNDNGTIAGIVTKEHLANWASNNSKLLLDCPRRLVTLPVQGKTAADRGRVTGYQFMFAPVFPHKTPQDKIFIDATTVETVGGIIKEGNSIRCTGSSDVQLFFKSYMEMVVEWKDEISGIVTPTVQDVAVVDATKGQLPKMNPIANITDFMKRK